MTSPTLPVLVAQDDLRSTRDGVYQANRRYYEGEHAIARNRRGAGMRATPRNLTALFVDTVTDFLGTSSVSFGDGAAADAAEAYLLEVLEAEDFEVLDYDTEISCAVDGDSVVKVTWDDVEQRPRLAGVDPGTIWTRHRPDDPMSVDMVAQRYRLHPGDFPALFGDRLQYVASGDAWITEGWTAATWEMWLDGDRVLFEPNPYGFIPYIVTPNWRGPGRFWGTGDPVRIRALQDRYNFAAADADDIMALQGTIVVLEGVGEANLVVRPGALWELPEDAKAYALDLLGGGGAASRLEYMRDLRQVTHDVARIPISALGNTSRQLSGVALQMEIGPLLRLVARKRLTRTSSLRKRARMIVELGRRFGGLEVPANLRPVVSWTEAVPADRGADLQNAEAELALGRDTASVLRGIGVEDPEAELAKRASQISAGLVGPAGHRTGGSNESGIPEPAGS